MSSTSTSVNSVVIPDAGNEAPRPMHLIDELGTSASSSARCAACLAASAGHDGKMVTPYLDINAANWTIGGSSRNAERGLQSFCPSGVQSARREGLREVLHLRRHDHAPELAPQPRRPQGQGLAVGRAQPRAGVRGALVNAPDERGGGGDPAASASASAGPVGVGRPSPRSSPFSRGQLEARAPRRPRPERGGHVGPELARPGPGRPPRRGVERRTAKACCCRRGGRRVGAQGWPPYRATRTELRAQERGPRPNRVRWPCPRRGGGAGAARGRRRASSAFGSAAAAPTARARARRRTARAPPAPRRPAARPAIRN